jgi:hypothetical protein
MNRYCYIPSSEEPVPEKPKDKSPDPDNKGT